MTKITKQAVDFFVAEIDKIDAMSLYDRSLQKINFNTQYKAAEAENDEVKMGDIKRAFYKQTVRDWVYFLSEIKSDFKKLTIEIRLLPEAVSYLLTEDIDQLLAVCYGVKYFIDNQYSGQLYFPEQKSVTIQLVFDFPSDQIREKFKEEITDTGENELLKKIYTREIPYTDVTYILSPLQLTVLPASLVAQIMQQTTSANLLVDAQLQVLQGINPPTETTLMCSESQQNQIEYNQWFLDTYRRLQACRKAAPSIYGRMKRINTHDLFHAEKLSETELQQQYYAIGNSVESNQLQQMIEEMDKQFGANLLIGRLHKK